MSISYGEVSTITKSALVKRRRAYRAEAIDVLQRLLTEDETGERADTALRVLSNREREVLELIASGRSAKEAAVQLGLSVKTIESHRGSIMRKTNLFSVAELTRYAVREGIARL